MKKEQIALRKSLPAAEVVKRGKDLGNHHTNLKKKIYTHLSPKLSKEKAFFSLGSKFSYRLDFVTLGSILDICVFDS